MSRLSCHVATTSEKDPKWMQKLSHFVVFYSIPQSPSPLLSIPTLAFFSSPSPPIFFTFLLSFWEKKKRETKAAAANGRLGSGLSSDSAVRIALSWTVVSNTW
ncbi:hypothetical protein ES332_D11G043400v1 [Gossypium tomentosum]|uniref:Uncharacterized protein n=1 Tax=Gossypium tomentosum TaxID=34277 RepID=A0A5D2IJL1_GOSTO|nr:hypothetical protein ES332_D11G043400v1 [Gossypium tomentosum]